MGLFDSVAVVWDKPLRWPAGSRAAGDNPMLQAVLGLMNQNGEAGWVSR